MADKIEFVVTAKNATKAVFDEIQSSLGSVEGLLGKLTGALSVGAVAAYVEHLGDLADELDNASLLLGVSAQQLREWQQVAELSNISGEQFTTLLEKLSKSAGEAVGGNKALIESFAKLGITQDDLKGDLSDLDALFPAVVEGLRAMGDNYAQVATSQEIFSRGGIQMLGWIRSAPEDIERVTQKFREQAGVMTDEEVRAVADAKDAWDAFLNMLEQRALKTLAQTIATIKEFQEAKYGNEFRAAVAEQRELMAELANLEAELRDMQETAPPEQGWLMKFLGLLPGGPIDEEGLKARIAEIKARIGQIIATAPAPTANEPPLDGSGGGVAPIDPALQEAIAASQAAAQQIIDLDVLRTESERIQSEYRIEQARLEAEQRAIILQSLTEAERIAAEQRAEFEKKVEKQKQLAAAQGALQRFAIAAQGHKKLFELGKAAAIADAIVNTYKAVQAARAVGWPMGPILAGIELAAGLANVAAIQSATFGGGAATVQGAGPGGYAPAMSQAQVAPPNALADPNKQQQGTVEIVVRGGDSAGQALLDLLSVEINQRDQVFIKNGSRQAAELAG